MTTTIALSSAPGESTFAAADVEFSSEDDLARSRATDLFAGVAQRTDSVQSLIIDRAITGINAVR